MSSTCDAVLVLPDVADETRPAVGGNIDWVGMERMQMPIFFDGGDGDIQRARAEVDACVNLVGQRQRGIHMSRLYLLTDRHLGTRAVDATLLESLLRAFLESHRGISDRARIRIRFEQLVRRRSLRSNHLGWRAYPVMIEALLHGDRFHLEFNTEVTYSSTCPASAALSRQLIQQEFARKFDTAERMDRDAVLDWLGSEEGIVATPHAQRSRARLRVRVADDTSFNLIALLDRVEASLQTAVLAAVKREDEQAFALANGANPMFCEDAVRRIQRVLDADPGIADFHIGVEHHESLHPHDAVAYAVKP
ncbi:MAG TPA: GTP cyclohydrolase FolE2 [Rhodanobacteraceae bacterium]|nr:GTP cyclohydrolase FolE2 [Rhodanobacteraceae bacterium]